jgi:hypothetical protein
VLDVEEEMLTFRNKVDQTGLNIPMPLTDNGCQMVLAVVHERSERYAGIGRRLNEHYRRLYPNAITFESCHYDRERIWTQAERNHLFRHTNGEGGDANDRELSEDSDDLV